jgi:hypothetical protein
MSFDMDIELARDVVRTAFRSSSELQALLGVIKQRCSPEEYDSYGRGIATAIDAIGVALINKVLTAHPELSAEIESSIAKDGRFT